MQLAQNKVGIFNYTLTNKGGEVLDTSEGREPLAYIHGIGNIIVGLEEALEGKGKGDSLEVSIEPAKAYGFRQDSLMQELPQSDFESIPELKIGMQLQTETEAGVQVVTVTKIENDMVTVDGNHPLAGETLNFAVEVTEVREASEEEMAHGHVHGPGGHQH